MRTLELLAPAKDLACGMAAISHGADAVYIGAQRFGARAAAGNTTDDIAKLCQYAHQFDAKVYVTVNTLVFDDELEATRSLLKELKAAGVDAILVQDMSVLTMCKELGITAHASTQTDNRTKEKVAWLHALGFERVVLARELSLEEIKAIHAAEPEVELEVFVHGALCVSYSGQCYASEHCFGRSANRGACAQFCRMKFDLIDADGKEIEHQRHLLSLKDLCQIDHLEALAEAGAVSFKIEGRLKDADYVKNVVAAYSQRLNQLIAKHPDRYERSSHGTVTYAFEPNLKKTFNRGFTNYFLNGRKPDIASFDTPKALGEYVGKVKELRSHSFNVSSTAAFANGDGLCFFNEAHELEGFRVNRAEGNRLYPLRMPVGLKPGTALYRNHDVVFERLLNGDTAQRKIAVTMRLTATADGFSLEMSDGRQTVNTAIACEHQPAQKPQRENIIRQLTKLGNTPYLCDDITIDAEAERLFIPSSLLADLRRETVQLLDSRDSLSGLPKQPSGTAEAAFRDCRSYVSTMPKGFFANIANKEARAFYERLGAKDLDEAFELTHPHYGMLMQCRHCIRYSLGFCVRHSGRRPTWKEPLMLRLGDGRKFRLEFDCKNCQMNVYATD